MVTMASFLEYLNAITVYLIGVQIIYGLTIFILGETMIGYFEWGHYKNPENFLQKLQNVFMNSTIGLGYYIYIRLEKYSWFYRKILYLFWLTIAGEG